MCRNLAQELRDLNLQATGSMRQAEMQRLVHQTLRDNLKSTYEAYCAAPSWNDRAELDAYNAADKAWDAHVDEHRRQAARIRAERVK